MKLPGDEEMASRSSVHPIQLLLCRVAILSWLLLTAVHGPAETRVQIDDRLIEALARFGEAPVIVELDVPSAHRTGVWPSEPAATLAAVESLRRDIETVADRVLGRLPARDIRGLKRYDAFPLLALIVDEASLNALAADRAVTGITLDTAVALDMDDTITLIQANNNHFLNYTGTGWTVAILDTGVQKSHPALFGKVISEACYSSNLPAQNVSSLCPGGVTTSTALNSGLNCAQGISGCDHGTHVAGIAARVAPAANLIAIQVFSRFSDGGGLTPCQDINRPSPCTKAQWSDIIAGLNRVWLLHVTPNNINVAAVNMSLGGGQYSAPCDSESQFSGVLLAINQLRDQGVATVASAGNSSYRNAMGAPACLTPTISVASSTKSNQIASTSNISLLTTMVAPGVSILAPVPTNLTPIYQTRSGTSMAAPHVAGAIATLKEARPGATVPQLVTAMTNVNSPLITDTRSGGFVTKRRLNTWSALCALVSCDGDDFRTIGSNQSLIGAISPAADVDHYYFYGTVGQRLTLRMNRTSGAHDPYLELLSPSGFRVAFNDNGGGGVNALINGYLLPQTGLYQIRARSMNNATGMYELISSTQTERLNPVPQISFLSPSSAAGSYFASDFWVAIYGNNFMPDSQVRWNGQLRAKFYSSPTLMYIRVLGTDLLWPWPRNAWVTVVNPTPGGGESNARAFYVNDPFLGETRLLSPESGSSITVGQQQAFSIEWEAPPETGTWRDMQAMDLRLRDQFDEVAAWIQVVEAPGPGSFYRLLNGAGEVVDEGLPGEARDLVLPGMVTLHLADSTFSGSGLIATMTPVLSFDEEAVGSYNIEFRVDTKSGEDDDPKVQEDILGTFAVLPDGCEVALSDVSIQAPPVGQTVLSYNYDATVVPSNATEPLTWTWIPEPQSGQGTPNAVYQWPDAGDQMASVMVENCGSFAAGMHLQRMRTTSFPDLVISQRAEPSVVSGQAVMYRMTVRNRGRDDAPALQIRAPLPQGATLLEVSDDGKLIGGEVVWNPGALPGFGASIEVSYTVSATQDLASSGYSASSGSGQNVTGSEIIHTRVVDGQVLAHPVDTRLLAVPDLARWQIPGGNVFASVTVTYEKLVDPGVPFPGEVGPLLHAFRMAAHDGEDWLEDFQFGDGSSLMLKAGADLWDCQALLAPAGTYGLFESKDSTDHAALQVYLDDTGWVEVDAACSRADHIFADRYE